MICYPAAIEGYYRVFWVFQAFWGDIIVGFFGCFRRNFIIKGILRLNLSNDLNTSTRLGDRSTSIKLDKHKSVKS